MNNSETKSKLLRMIEASGNELRMKAEEITGIDNYTMQVKVTITCDIQKPPTISVSKKSINMGAFEAAEGNLIGGSM